MTSIVDLRGRSVLTALKPENARFLKQFVGTLSAHYPGRGHLTIIVNAPSFFNRIWAFISPVLRPATRAKVRIIGDLSVEGNRKEAEEILGAGVDLGALLTDVTPTSDMEEELAARTREALKAAGCEMRKLA